MEWNERKAKILETMDLNFNKYERIDSLDNLKDMNLDQLGDSLNGLIKKRISPVDRKIVFELVSKIKEKISPLSIEYLRYLILTSDGINHSTAIKMITSNFGMVKTKSQMRKIKSILREFVDFKIDIRLAPRKEISNVKGSLVRTNKNRVYHFIYW